MNSASLKIEVQKKYAESLILNVSRHCFGRKVNKKQLYFQYCRIRIREGNFRREYENINIEFENNRKRIELYKKALKYLKILLKI